MNSCVLMAKIVRRPELRYTQDNQTAFTQMLVEFEGARAEDPPTTLRAVAWGNLASEVAESYGEGDRVVLEGRLSMQLFDRPEGFKEKRAELVISHLYRLDGSVTSGEKAASVRDKVVALNPRATKAPAPAKKDDDGDFEYDSSYELSNPPLQPVGDSIEENLDEIPF